MMGKIKILGLILFALLSFGCASEQFLNEEKFSAKLAKGENLTVELSANKSTGFVWEIISDGSPVLKLVSREYIVEDVKSSLGAGGKERFTFLADGKGEVTLMFIYKRPWEKNGNTKMYRYSVLVE